MPPIKEKTVFSTDRQVATLKPNSDGSRADYRHKTETGLELRVSLSNKSWRICYSLNGKRRFYTLPNGYPECSLENAVRECRRIRAEAARGDDPLAERQIRKSAPTVADVMNVYFEETKMLPKGRKESKRISNKEILPWFGELKAIDLNRQHIKELHKTIVDRGAPVMANRVIELMRRAFNHAFEEEMIATNTFPSIKKIKSPEHSRERVLTDEEIRALWPAMDTLRPNMRDIHKLLLLLGQRTQDICAMRVDAIDVEHKQWTVPAPPRGKNKQPNILPLPPLSWEIIAPRLTNSEWIFPSSYNTTRKNYTGAGHANSTKNARIGLTEITGVTDWTGHDLRRTLRTLLAREGVQPHIAEKVVGHVQGGVEGIYDRYTYLKEKGDALRKLEKAVRKIVGLDSNESKVIKLNKING